MIGGIQDITQPVEKGSVSVADVTAAALARAAADRHNAVTCTLNDRAQRDARRVASAIAGGHSPGPFAGVPFGVKDLFDIAGVVTTAGAAARREASPATSDAEAVKRLCAAGGIPVATFNMDEYAYGFATINATWGTTRNPHDPMRLAGGSSGGSAAAVAAGIVPFALGTDTNGSIRVPASLCGIWGLKPTHGSLPMEGVFPFVDSFDDIGPFTRSAADLALVHKVLSAGNPADADEPVTGFKVAILGGWFANNVTPALETAIAKLSTALGNLEQVELDAVDSARSAAFVMTAAEGGRRHLPTLRNNPMAFDPATRDRLIAGALVPAAAYLDAVEFRAAFRDAVLTLFERWDVLIAPAVPGVAPLIEDPTITIDGEIVSARANLGLYTQPMSFVGLPVVAAPIGMFDGLPIGIQLIGAPGKDRALISYACELERRGFLGAAVCPLPPCGAGCAP